MPISRHFKPTPQRTLRAIFNHHRWLVSGGVAGRQFGYGGQIYDVREQNLDGIDLSLGVATEHDFTNSSLRHSRFIGTDCEETTFDNTDLEGSTFHGANLAAVDLINTDTARVDFSEAITEHAIWKQTEIAKIMHALRESPPPKFIANKREHWSLWRRSHLSPS